MQGQREQGGESWGTSQVLQRHTGSLLPGRDPRTPALSIRQTACPEPADPLCARWSASTIHPSWPPRGGDLPRTRMRTGAGEACSRSCGEAGHPAPCGPSVLSRWGLGTWGPKGSPHLVPPLSPQISSSSPGTPLRGEVPQPRSGEPFPAVVCSRHKSPPPSGNPPSTGCPCSPWPCVRVRVQQGPGTRGGKLPRPPPSQGPQNHGGAPFRNPGDRQSSTPWGEEH